jgi:LPXTG-site transpeptidase (sortase) family protein
MTTRMNILIFVVLAAILANCTTTPVVNTPLHTAEVRIVHEISPTPPPTAVAPTSAFTTTLPTPTVPSVQALAARTFGGELIETISLPSIGVESAVVAVGWTVSGASDPGSEPAVWDSPGPLVGWTINSGLPETGGNIILYGHNNMYGSVFKDLWKLQPGDKLSLETGLEARQYVVDRVLLLPVMNANSTQRQAYLAYLQQIEQPRLTIISCWPPESNTHRVVVIAYPIMMP